MRRLQPQIPFEDNTQNSPEIELRGVPLMIILNCVLRLLFFVLCLLFFIES